MQLNLPSPLQQVSYRPWSDSGLHVYIKRDDLIHPEISGNKWRKLSGYLKQYEAGSYQRILTFGGAFSNHLTATAAACFYLKIPLIAVHRGELHAGSPVFFAAKRFGFRLHPVSRTEYREKESADFIAQMLQIHGQDTLIVPEGGSGPEGWEGCASIVEEIDFDFDYLMLPTGTATTLIGVGKALKDTAKVIGISVLKGEDTLSQKINEQLSDRQFELIHGYHFGGYAKKSEVLLDFCRSFTAQTGIPLDYVYTGKMIFAFDDLVRQGYFPKGSRIVLLHTGGLANAPIS